MQTGIYRVAWGIWGIGLYDSVSPLMRNKVFYLFGKYVKKPSAFLFYYVTAVGTQFSGLTKAMLNLDLRPSTQPKYHLTKGPGGRKNATRVTCAKCGYWFYRSCLKINYTAVNSCAFVCPLVIPDGSDLNGANAGLSQRFGFSLGRKWVCANRDT